MLRKTLHQAFDTFIRLSIILSQRFESYIFNKLYHLTAKFYSV